MQLIGAYRILYDPNSALKLLSSDRDAALNELWENLYHQGDVDTASYVAVPKLVEEGELSLVAAIEVARHEERNPDVPTEILSAYKQALLDALGSTPAGEEQFKGYYVIHASVHGQSNLAKALDLMSIEEVLEEYA